MRKGDRFQRRGASGFLPAIIAAILCISWWGAAVCAPNQSEVPYETTIEGEDHRILEDFFARFERDETNVALSKKVKRVLLQALQDTCGEPVSHLKEGADGSAAVAVKVLFVERRKAERPIRALIAFICLSKGSESTSRFHAELAAALVVDRASSRLSIIEQDWDHGKHPEPVRIAVEREVRIGGRDVVGITSVRSNEAESSDESVPVLREETISFYVFGDNRIKFAGSVLKTREERQSDDNGEVRNVYSGALVFKKDMKGNVVGILSPYTITRNGKRTGKGLVRYWWDTENEAFVKE